MIPLAASGNWFAMAHSASVTSPPDTCLAATAASGRMLAFRASTSDIEVRFSDNSWSLPADVAGTLVVDVGAYHVALDISANTNNVVAAVVTPEQLQSMIAAMGKAKSMTVTAGKAAPATMSLSASKTVTTAFLTCAGISAPGEGGGANPFK
ncbi:MAG: hypothetical protein WCF20_05405 [Methylovirgula sp.]